MQRRLSELEQRIGRPLVRRHPTGYRLTEFGAAQLKGQSLATRARRLTAIAHPDFREELDRYAFDIAKRGF